MWPLIQHIRPDVTKTPSSAKSALADLQQRSCMVKMLCDRTNLLEDLNLRHNANCMLSFNAKFYRRHNSVSAKTVCDIKRDILWAQRSTGQSYRPAAWWLCLEPLYDTEKKYKEYRQRLTMIPAGVYRNQTIRNANTREPAGSPRTVGATGLVSLSLTSPTSF